MKNFKTWLLGFGSGLLLLLGYILKEKTSKEGDTYNLDIKKTKAKRGGRVNISPNIRINKENKEERKRKRKEQPEEPEQPTKKEKREERKAKRRLKRKK